MQLVVARQYSIVKDLDRYCSHLSRTATLGRSCRSQMTPFAFRRARRQFRLNDGLVGLDRLELSTSPLSGVRSSHLSYRPMRLMAGGAGRDRTGDLLNANQALSQLSYSPLFIWLTPTFVERPAQASRLFSRPIGRCRTAPGRPANKFAKL